MSAVRRGMAATAIAWAAAAAPVRGQAPAPVGGESAAAMAVVTRLFDAMRAGDTAAVRATFAPGTALQSALVGRDGVPVVRATAIDDFVKSIGARPAGTVLDERLRNPVVHVDGPLAQVWVEYGFFVSGTFSHCGVDAFTLAKGSAGWRIIAIADTRQREGWTGW